jgi:glyoxylase-like metal-dependent hydrolase (beta-lactamase superfamily II)
MKLRYKIAIVLFAFLCVAYYYLLRVGGAPEACHFTIDLPRLRSLAASVPGERPREIRVEHLATFRMPAAALVWTGGPLSPIEMRDYAYELVYPDHTIIIDTGMDDAQSKSAHTSFSDPAAWTRVDAALQKAAAIYVTHEHADHLGGVFAVASHLRMETVHLTREQLGHLDLARPLVAPPGFVEKLQPLDYDAVTAVAPGIVLVKAPGHTPGSQFVFVQLADGREVLFLGDTAWHTENLTERRGPPHLTSLMLHNDREANACQLAAASDLMTQVQSLSVVPGHDGRVIDRLLAAGVLQRGFR